MEIWKSIIGFETKYMVSSIGRVKSIRTFECENGFKYTVDKKILSANNNGRGYLQISLKNEDNIRKTIKIHRLVAIAFIPNTLNKPEVNHINGNKLDNRMENLEWVTTHENCKHREKNGLGNVSVANNSRKRKVAKIDKDTDEIIHIYDSAKDAERIHGYRSKNISQVALGEKKTHHSFKWKYI